MQMYNSICYALTQNHEQVKTHDWKFKELFKSIKEHCMEDAVHCLALKCAAQWVHSSRTRYNILPLLQTEIAFLCEALDDNSQIEWQSPIAHMIHYEPTGTAYSDSCLHSDGGFSTDMGFWWHMEWPSWVYHRMKKFLANDINGHFITINALDLFQ
jgi:hypothetical protein